MSQRPDELSSLELARRAGAGERRAAGRLISHIEGGHPGVAAALRTLYSARLATPVIGITGPPGAGKSTLADQLIAHWRARSETVAVLAVDPSSARSGGAILGDRVRMGQHNTDAGVFIRSMSARGCLGGLSSAAGDALVVLDAMGFDRILVETVGVGQNEIDILHHADTVLVVQTPVGGDAVQAMKSGLLEIADVFVVNKCDAPGADRTVAQLREAVERQWHAAHGGWQIPILKTQASSGAGVDELDRVLSQFGAYLDADPALATARRRDRTRALLAERLAELLRAAHTTLTQHNALFEQRLDDIVAGRCDPASAAADILQKARVGGQP